MRCGRPGGAFTHGIELPVLVAQLPDAERRRARARRDARRKPRFEVKSRGKKYWCGAGNTATLPPAVFIASVR